MVARMEKCRQCKTQLVVPENARNFQCSVCRAINPIRSKDPVRQATRWVKGLINSISKDFSSYYSTSMNYIPSYGYEPARRPMMPAVNCNKRALLIGVTYRGTSYELKGTINDVNCMRFLLRDKYDFRDDSILTLTEDERDPYRIPTRENIKRAMLWLVQDTKAGDSLVFHFSGHGSQRRDYNRDERDGIDETLCPLDYEREGMIVDDEVNETLVRPLRTGVKLHALIDACHSGTVLDLPYLCRINSSGYFQWENHNPRSGKYKGTSGGVVFSFSSCDDHQTSADTTILSGKTMTGAMTYSFIQAVLSQPNMTYGRILYAMRSAIREADSTTRITGPIGSLVRKLFCVGLSQEPQLSSSEKFDIHTKKFIL